MDNMPSNNLDSQDSYIIDEPVNTKDDDRLERYPIAERIVKTIVSRKDPSSFVLNFVHNIFEKEKEKDYKDFHCIKFNPWYFRDEDQLLINFFENLSSEIDGRIILNRERIGSSIKNYVTALVPPNALKIGIGVATLDIGNTVQGWGNSLSDISLDERKKNLEKFLENEKKKIVIMIDDVDRLDKNEIQTVLKLVKLLANFKHTTYILAFDDEMVAKAIGDKYGDDKEAGKGFLEKIVQVPIPLPKLSSDSLESFCFKEVKQVLESFDINLTDDEWLRFTENFESGLSIRVQTIRMVKRYINALIFALPLIKNEVNTVDFLLLEGMRIFYPQLYSDIRDNPSDYIALQGIKFRNDLQYRQSKLDTLKAKWNKLVNDEAEGIRLLFCLFPHIRNMFRTSDVVNSDYLITRETLREQKLKIKQGVGTEEYFRRFFEYKIPNYDISDVEIDKIFNQTPVLQSNFSKTILSFIDQGKADAFELKVTNRLNNLSPTIAEELAITLSKLDWRLLVSNHQKPIRFSINTYPLPFLFEKLVYSLIEKVPEIEQRYILLETIINQAELFPFVVNFFPEFVVADENQWISSEQNNVLGKIIANRILHHFEKTSIFQRDNYPPLIGILIEFGGKEENHKLFEREIKSNADNALTLLSYFCYKKGHDFSQLIQIVDIEVVYNAIPENLKESLSSQKTLEEKKQSYNYFLEWYRQNHSDQNLTIAATKVSEASFSKVWDNPEDAKYNEL
jgi:hypothetical protein